MRVQKKNKAFAYRGTIGDYNYLQCVFRKYELFFKLLRKSKDNFPSKISSQFSKNTIKVHLLWTKKIESKNIMLALCIGYLLAYLGKKAHLCTESLKWFSIESHSTEYISSLLYVYFILLGSYFTDRSYKCYSPHFQF